MSKKFREKILKGNSIC